MERRTLPRTSVDVSSVGLSAGMWRTADLNRWRAVSSKVRAAGVNLFDLTGATAERELYLGRVLREDRQSTVFLVGRSTDQLARAEGPLGTRATPDGGADLEGRLRRSLSGLGAGARGRNRLLVEWAPSSQPTVSEREAVAALEQLVKAGELDAWGMLGRGSWAGDGPTPYFISDRISLLERPEPAPMDLHDVALIARDPMAAGRLDGRRFGAGPWAALPTARPRPLSELQNEFAPILRLGPLVRSGERTLAQAALHYALRVAGATCALLPWLDPGRMGELLGFNDSPPFSPEELDFIRSLPTRSRGSKGIALASSVHARSDFREI